MTHARPSHHSFVATRQLATAATNTVDWHLDNWLDNGGVWTPARYTPIRFTMTTHILLSDGQVYMSDSTDIGER